MKIKRDQDLKITDNSTQWIERYNGLIKEVKQRQSELSKQISLLDLQEQDILHYIELRKCDAVISAKLMKKLKEIRAKRRTVKEEHSAISSITSTAKESKYTTDKSYKFKTNIIVDLLEDTINE